MFNTMIVKMIYIYLKFHEVPLIGHLLMAQLVDFEILSRAITCAILKLDMHHCIKMMHSLFHEILFIGSSDLIWLFQNNSCTI